ncbi:hypothetical protein TrLO_g575 [Triparma laevis f. longispina]|nr:hypothetical protein TrLO_g575 [Triparma laevis f. longispina]
MDKENAVRRPTSSLYSPGYSAKLASKAGDIKLKRAPLTPTRMNVDFSKAETKGSDREESSSGGGFGAFGSLLMDAAKDAQAERDTVHTRRLVAQEKSMTAKRRAKEEEESKRVAALLEEEENDKLLAARLLQEEREYEKLQEENREAQEKKDSEFAALHESEMKQEVLEEEKKQDKKDSELARVMMREEKDAVLAERFMAAEKMALEAQKKVEERDFLKARELQNELEYAHAKECEAKDGRDRQVARSYEIKDQRFNHREARNQSWLDEIAANYIQIFENHDNDDNVEEDKKMSKEEFKLCHDFAAWQDAQMEIHDVMAGICVSARLPSLESVEFDVGESGKEVELHCMSVKKAGHEVRLIHKNIQLYHELRSAVQTSYVAPPPCDVEKVSTYSIHLQLDACVGVGITARDISYVYEEGSGVLYVYLNGLKLRAGDKDEGEKGKGVEGVSKAKSSLLARMVDKMSFRGKKK